MLEDPAVFLTSSVFSFSACADKQDIPAGTTIHNIELRPGKGGQMVRSAGTCAVLVKKGDDGFALVKLPSGEQRLVRSHCTATVGVVSNAPHQNRKLGKAGASRWMGRMCASSTRHPSALP